MSEMAKRQGINVDLDIWDSMTHDFQFYGNFLAESRGALIKIGEVVDRHTDCRFHSAPGTAVAQRGSPGRPTAR